MRRRSARPTSTFCRRAGDRWRAKPYPRNRLSTAIASADFSRPPTRSASCLAAIPGHRRITLSLAFGSKSDFSPLPNSLAIMLSASSPIGEHLPTSGSKWEIENASGNHAVSKLAFALGSSENTITDCSAGARLLCSQMQAVESSSPIGRFHTL